MRQYVLGLLLAALVVIGPAAQVRAQDAPGLGASNDAILLDMLGRAEAHGFALDEFHLGEAASALTAPDPALHGLAEGTLSAAAIAYARAQHGGRLPEARFPANWAIRPAPYDAAADFAAAVANNRLAAWAQALPPPDSRYAALVETYARYRALAAQGGWPTLALKPALKPGAVGDAVDALRRRLAVEDSSVVLPAAPEPGAEPVPATYDPALAEAVGRAQRRYGLEPDGVAGPTTLSALNVPVEQRLDQIRANLERWRWVPRALPAYRVELNIAAADLALYDEGKPGLTMRAIVGKAGKPTPMFQDHIRAVVFNPPWNVPADIAAKEIWPKIRRNPGYMAREGFVVTPSGGLQQLPGPRCALGTIKFDLSNAFGVYLHDTSSRRLFARESRTLSHGCMRVEKPNLLAKRLLRDDPDWAGMKIDFALLSGKTVRAPMRDPVPVYVFYWTAFVDDDGQVEFRKDVYGWDRKLLDAL